MTRRYWKGARSGLDTVRAHLLVRPRGGAGHCVLGCGSDHALVRDLAFDQDEPGAYICVRANPVRLLGCGEEERLVEGKGKEKERKSRGKKQ